tara:strand:+ start:307 stop:525 length:219 start_codon:yes stop_codon:yes gene_type:complete
VIERHTYTIQHDADASAVTSETVEGLVEDLSKSTGTEYTIRQTWVCPRCRGEWTEPRRCRRCEALARAAGHE